MSNNPDSNRALKMVVISMGLVLIGGTILLFVLVFNKMTNKDESGEIHVPRAYRHCEQTDVPLSIGETVKRIEFDGMVARVITELPQGSTSLKLVHSCSGELLGSVTLSHGD